MMEIAGIGMAVVALVATLFGLAVTGFWIWMLIDCVSNEPSEGNDKIIWILIIIFTHGLGALIYFFVRRPERIRDYGH
jgi:phosphotransferase system  glucose/maltose/N-acetylglucosamine-specific IIC component